MVDIIKINYHQESESKDATAPLMNRLDPVWVFLEAQKDRWFYWTVAAFMAGCAAINVIPADYKAHEYELISIVCLAILISLVRMKARGSYLLSLSLVLLAGLSYTAYRSEMDGVGPIKGRIGPIQIIGQVEDIDLDGGRVRLLLTDIIIDNVPGRSVGFPRRGKVRLTVSAGQPLPVIGDRVGLRAVLKPPPRPVYPGSFDIGRRSWFGGISAYGFSLGNLSIEERDARPGFEQLFLSALKELRSRVSFRVRNAVPGSTGDILDALITGERQGIEDRDRDALRDAGLAHLLAISGLHVGLVATSVHLFVRYMLSLVPWVSLRIPARKPAALAAMCAALGYALLAGFTVPTMRAFVMTSLALFAVMVDRSPISMRLVAVSALVVMLVSPDSVAGASFQMSFAAVMALVAFYEGDGGRRLVVLMREKGQRRIAGYFLATVATTLVAGTATMPFSIYHFGRFAVYGVVSNFMAMPIMGFLVMPGALMGVLLMPLGLEHWPLVLSSLGVDAVLAVARAVSSIPGAVLICAEPGIPVAAVLSFALLWGCLWRGRVRYLAAIPVALGLLFLVMDGRVPVVIVSEDGEVGIPLEDGILLVNDPARARYESDIWMESLGLTAKRSFAEQIEEYPIEQGVENFIALSCDDAGCIYRTDHTRGSISVSILKDPEGIGADCRRADVVISPVPVPRYGCGRDGALLIDPFYLKDHGAVAVFRDEGNGSGRPVRLDTVEGHRAGRPWALSGRRGFNR